LPFNRRLGGINRACRSSGHILVSIHAFSSAYVSEPSPLEHP